jgi:ElaB/YqjD/DUF883 family membrane-anchored ribosome-binding protein
MVTDSEAHGPITSADQIRKIAKREAAGDVVDQQTAASASSTGHVGSNRLREAALEVKDQAKVVAGQVATKATEAYQQAKSIAERRAVDGRSAIADRPYAAVGLGILIGLVVGHVLSARRPAVVYLRVKGAEHLAHR